MAKRQTQKRPPLELNLKEGAFTAWCKRQGYDGVTQECIQKGLASDNPTIRKRANFARNARKWKKGGG